MSGAPVTIDRQAPELAAVATSAAERKVRRMRAVSPDKYEGADGYVLQREYGLTPNGNPMNGRWVLRDGEGRMLDFDRYRSDLAERFQLKLEHPGS